MPFLFDIKRYSINDGPGVRITVFFKGCPLSCRWCHNPESISFKSEKLYNRSKCIGCGSCVAVCSENALTLTTSGEIITDFSRCILCGKCTEVCPTKAVEMSGRDYTENELMDLIMKETHIIDNSGGGVTFSGGEPLMHPKELKNLLIICGKAGIHSAVDTSGHVKSSILEDILPHTDLFLYDLKLMNSEKHRKWTGVNNELILMNLRLISDKGKDYQIRMPLIEGVNCNEENIRETLTFLCGLKNRPSAVGLLPYHNIALKKFEKLGRNYHEEGMKKPSDNKVNLIKNLFEQHGFKVNIGG